MPTDIHTTDTDLAAALLAKGARLQGHTVEDRRVRWDIQQINPQWIDDYRTGRDRITAFLRQRRVLVTIAKTETNPNHIR